jgi:hypothetical protein
MASEPNLRDLLGGDDASRPGARGIDTASVIRRARRRRLPARVAVGGAAVLVIGGIGVAGVQGLGGAGVTSSASDETAFDAPTTEQAPLSTGDTFMGASEGPADSSGLKRAPADRINLCGGALAEVAPSATGLVLTASFPDAAAGSTSVPGTVTLTNTGTAPVAGYTSATPAVTLSQGGVVLWHSNGPTIQMIRDVALAPGESIDFEASFTPVVCTVDDDTAEAFRTDLPAAPAGEYQVSAAADVMVGDSLELVTGPAQTVRLG